MPVHTLRPHALRPHALPAAAALGCLLALTACGTSDDSSANPSASATTSAQTTTSPSTTPSATPAADEWVDEASATSSLAAFRAQLATTDGYVVRRNERTSISGQYIGTNVLTKINVASRRAESMQSFEVSDESMWSQLAPGETADQAKDLTLLLVTDFSKTPTGQFMTFPNEPAWAGKWLRLDASSAADGTDAGVLAGAALESVEIGDFAAGVLAIADLDPVGFDGADAALTYDVPADVAVQWMPTKLATTLLTAGVDLTTLTAMTRATLTGEDDGLEAVVDLTPMLREAASLVDATTTKAYLNGVGLAVTIRIEALGRAEALELPAPDAIVTAPPVSE